MKKMALVLLIILGLFSFSSCSTNPYEGKITKYDSEDSLKEFINDNNKGDYIFDYYTKISSHEPDEGILNDDRYLFYLVNSKKISIIDTIDDSIYFIEYNDATLAKVILFMKKLYVFLNNYENQNTHKIFIYNLTDIKNIKLLKEITYENSFYRNAFIYNSQIFYHSINRELYLNKNEVTFPKYKVDDKIYDYVYSDILVYDSKNYYFYNIIGLIDADLNLSSSVILGEIDGIVNHGSLYLDKNECITRVSLPTEEEYNSYIYKVNPGNYDYNFRTFEDKLVVILYDKSTPSTNRFTKKLKIFTEGDDKPEEIDLKYGNKYLEKFNFNGNVLFLADATYDAGMQRATLYYINLNESCIINKYSETRYITPSVYYKNNEIIVYGITPNSTGSASGSEISFHNKETFETKTQSEGDYNLEGFNDNFAFFREGKFIEVYARSDKELKILGSFEVYANTSYGVLVHHLNDKFYTYTGNDVQVNGSHFEYIKTINFSE